MCCLRKHPSTADAVPLPHAGKAYAERRFASIFIKGDARRLEDRSQVSDVSQSPSLIPNP